MDSGLIFKWTPDNNIWHNSKDAEQIILSMDKAKYEDSLEKNNGELDYHSNDNEKKRDDKKFLELYY